MRWARADWRNAGKQPDRDDTAALQGFWRAFGRIAARIPFAEELLTAYYCALDRETPSHVRAALLAALAYFAMPADTIPDVLPIVGFTDDAAVLAGAIKLVWNHITPDHRSAAHAALERTLPSR